MRTCFALLVSCSTSLLASAYAGDNETTTSVGVSMTWEGLVLPGPELEPKPIDDRKTAVVIRIVAVYPHGTDFRYDLAWYGLDPGTYNLCDFLQRKDGKPTSALPPALVEVKPIRPPGQVEPNKLTLDRPPQLGGYRTWLWVLGSLWILGLFALLATFFFPRTKKLDAVGPMRETLADRLKPLVEGAIAGTLSTPEIAKLERALVNAWRKRLKLERTEAGEAFSLLRGNSEAGPLLAQLEGWLHRPGEREPVDVSRLLEPYRNMPAESLDLEAEAKPT